VAFGEVAKSPRQANTAGLGGKGKRERRGELKESGGRGRREESGGGVKRRKGGAVPRNRAERATTSLALKPENLKKKKKKTPQQVVNTTHCTAKQSKAKQSIRGPGPAF
jgi:hypothetical protein